MGLNKVSRNNSRFLFFQNIYLGSYLGHRLIQKVDEMFSEQGNMKVTQNFACFY